MQNIMKIRPLRAGVFHEERQMDWWTDGQT